MEKDQLSFDTRELKILIPEKQQQVSAELTVPAAPIALMTLAHGAGSNMNHPFLKSLSFELAKNKIASLRFNFLYTENKKKMPDRVPVATQVVRSVVAAAHEHLPGMPVFCGGKSFGGRMSSQTLATWHPDYVKGIVFFGFPLHPAGVPSVTRADHLHGVKVPMLFLQGTRDALAEIKLVREVCGSLPLATLVEIENADHSFRAGKQTSIDFMAQRTGHWISNVLNNQWV